MTDLLRPQRALISVSDKSGLDTLAAALKGLDVEVLSTGGTAKALADLGLKVKEVADHTGFPEMMDGRVKTLHPMIHGGLLALRDKADHKTAMETHNIGPIDLLVVNLYPFEATVARGAGWDDTIENIDIGGPAMIRSAAKNHAHVAVVTDPSDYGALAEELKQGGITAAFRRTLAGKAFARTATYDSAIAARFNQETGTTLPERLSVGGQRGDLLRYGENPHQEAAFYSYGGKASPSVATAAQVQGKALSFNNLNDTDAAFSLVCDLGTDKAAVAIIKHANPCGAAVGSSVLDAYKKAVACDGVSAFGGIIATNRPLDAASAEAMTAIFTEVVIAPDADDAAKAIFAKKKNLRLLLTGGLASPADAGLNIRSLSGGLLVQTADTGQVAPDDIKVVTKRAPSTQELDDMILAFRIAKHVKSNAIIYVKDGATVGIGAGQMSRVDSSRIAARKAQDAAGEGTPATVGSVVASDAFFPFADGLLAAAEAGATAVIQPGGSMRDDEVIAAADEAGLAMVFTGMRHFRH